MPQEVQEAWLLVDEFVLCEAQRALLKLLRDVDSLPQPQPPALTEPEGPDPMALPQRSHSLHVSTGLVVCSAALCCHYVVCLLLFVTGRPCKNRKILDSCCLVIAKT